MAMSGIKTSLIVLDTALWTIYWSGVLMTVCPSVVCIHIVTLLPLCHLEWFSRYKSHSYLLEDSKLEVDIYSTFLLKHNGTHLMLIIFNDTYLISESCRWSFKGTLSSRMILWPLGSLIIAGWRERGSGWDSPGQSAVRSTQYVH